MQLTRSNHVTAMILELSVPIPVCCAPQSPDTIKRRFNNMLVEDSCRGIKSYADFLCTAHTLIQNKFVE